MAELSHDMNGMQTHAALTKMFPDHKDILKGWDTRIDVSVFYVGGHQKGRVYTYIPTVRGATRGARIHTYTAPGGRRPARPIPTYPTRKGGGRRGRYPHTRQERKGSYHTNLKPQPMTFR